MEEGPQSLDERNDEGPKTLNDGMVWETATEIQAHMSTGNSRIKLNVFVQIRLAECSIMFFIAPAMFLSVVRSVSKCALWQNYRQTFSTLFSDGVTGYRAGRGPFVSGDHP